MPMKREIEVHPVLHMDGDDTLHMTQRANGNWYYQRRIPTHSQPFFGNKKSIKISLRTKSVAEARVRARQLSVEHDVLFAQHETLATTTSKPKGYASNPLEVLVDVKASQAQHKEITQATSGNLVGTQSLLHAQVFTAPLKERESVFTGIEAMRDDLCELMCDLAENRLSEYDAKLSRSWRIIEGAMESEHYEYFVEQPFENQRQLVIESCRKSIQGLSSLTTQLTDVMAERLELPNASDTYLHELRGTQAPTESEHQSLLLSECVELYLKDREKDNMQPKTFESYKARMRLMLYILGDRPIDSLKRADALMFKDKLLQLPANLNKVSSFKGLPVDDVIALKPTPMAVSTANDTMTGVSSFFDWCVLNEYASKNAFKGLKVKTKKKASDERSAFTESDLKTLFQHPYFQGGESKHPHYYWLPVLGLYTDARLNELCQLHVCDVRRDDESGLWTMTITNTQEDQKTKNMSSIRTIPLHPKLIELGFVDYVQNLTHERVFPELKRGRDGYGQAPSKWFARFRDKVLPNAKNEHKAYHSFRHTFINALKQSGVSRSHAAAYVGHGDGSETFGRYGKAYVASALAPILDNITFDFDIKPRVLSN
ncbi:TPA: site-specific integrase [Vibrio parahaemolyticus]|nr:site-specific integrase [Vibrio parahaemolyticus]